MIEFLLHLLRRHPVAALVAIAMFVTAGFAKVVVKEIGATWRAWLQYRPPRKVRDRQDRRGAGRRVVARLSRRSISS